MAKVREEIVGKRFLSVSSSCKFKLSKLSECDWRAGVIRACTHKDIKHSELQVLVEYDDVTWQRREWLHVYGDETFQLFLLEHTLVWAPLCLGSKRAATALSPALIFEPLVDTVSLSELSERPVEHLHDRSVKFYEKSELQKFQESAWPWPCLREGEVAARNWIAEQDGQRILCTTPSVLLGFRVQVYRSEGTTQWYTAVIVGYNEATRELTVTDDTVLEAHSEDPSLVHIRLLGEGVVESILRGENVGITPRRSRSSCNNGHQTGVRHIRRDPVASSRGRKIPLPRLSNSSNSPNSVHDPSSPNQSSDPGAAFDVPKSPDEEPPLVSSRSKKSLSPKQSNKNQETKHTKESRVLLERIDEDEPPSSPKNLEDPDSAYRKNSKDAKRRNGHIGAVCDKIPGDNCVSNGALPKKASSALVKTLRISLEPLKSEKLSDSLIAKSVPKDAIDVQDCLENSQNVANKTDQTSVKELRVKSDSSLFAKPNNEENSPKEESETHSCSTVPECVSESVPVTSSVDGSTSRVTVTQVSVLSEPVTKSELEESPRTVNPGWTSSRVSVSNKSEPIGDLSPSLAVAGTVGGRAVTITATSGPAPQGSSRVASPPSVSITAVVRPSDNHDAVDLHQPPQCPASSLSSTRMDQCDGSSDSGVSVTERSVSRSSVLSDERSSSVEVKPNTPTPNSLNKNLSAQAPLALDRKENVKVWRNPAVLSQSELSIRHIHSLQHTMSQHYPNMSSHAVPPSAAAGVSAHNAAAAHAPAPSPVVSLGHSLPPGLPYPQHNAPPSLHMPHGLQPSIPATAALYSQLNPEVWKQLSHVPIQPPYPVMLPRHQDEFYLEERARHMDKQHAQKLHRERREQETRDKAEKNKMDRERERQKREREERGIPDWVDKDAQLVNQHFEESFRLASQKKGLAWNQAVGAPLAHKLDSRDSRGSSKPNGSQNDLFRKITEGEKMIHEGIHKAFRSDDTYADPHPKPPPPAHSKHPVDKSMAAGLSGYGSHYKDHKIAHRTDRDAYQLQEKASVIVQPDLKYKKVPGQSVSVSPKHRPVERQSPFASSSVPSPYKSYEPSSSPHMRVNAHISSVHSTSPHNLEISKSRHTTTSPNVIPTVVDSYHAAINKSAMNYANPMLPGLIPSHLHPSSVPTKLKVSSPPPRVYGKPGITSISPVPKSDGRPSPQQQVQPISMTRKSSLPPPAHENRRIPPSSSEPRILDVPFDARMYLAHPKMATPNSYSSRTSVQSSSSHAQLQPLDLGRKDDGLSQGHRRPGSPMYHQEFKKARLDTTSQAILSRVSEPSPLQFPAATAITTVENVAVNLQHSHTVTVIPKKSDEMCDKSSSPKCSLPSNSSMTRPENSSPGMKTEDTPSPGSGNVYVHKLKKAWLQRHVNMTDSTSASRSSDSPPSSESPSSPSAPHAREETKNPPPRKTSKPSSISNGHGRPSDEEESSTESDDSTSQKKSLKTRKAARGKKSSDSNSESGKESDGSESSGKRQEQTTKQEKEPRRKRGRKPKQKPKEEEPKIKKLKEDPTTTTNPLQKPPVSQLRKTGESFLQDRPCFEVAPKLPKCRECRWTSYQRNKKMPNIFCRFYAFRRLKYTKNGQCAVAGFSDPVKDAFGGDLRLWEPDTNQASLDLDVEKSKFLLTHVGDQFCDLFQQEKEAMALHMGEDDTVAWKRVVQGVREMCDVCETTLFNIHWACSKCGFVVCIDCYNVRKEGTVNVWSTEEGAKERDKYSWLLCASRVPHEQDKLMLTQIIAGNALNELGKKIHEIRYKWGIPMYCGCPEANKYKDKEPNENKSNGVNKDKSIKQEPQTVVNGKEPQEQVKEEDVSNSPLNFFANVAISNDKRDSESSNSDSDSDSDNKDGSTSTLRELLVRPNSKSSTSKEETPFKTKEPSKKKAKLDMLDDVISCVIDRGSDKDSKRDLIKVELKHFIRKYNYSRNGREPLPIRIMTKTESRLLYPKVPHSWLCDGKLLRLHDPFHDENVTVFQDQWKRGQPVIVSGVGQTLDQSLWNPESFSRDFGDVKNNLINCLTNNIVPNQPMKKFWDGFETFGKRLKDDKGQPMVLKLKDWPPGEDFAEVLPTRFEDLMKILPMGYYTRRNGSLNLAGRLPDCFVRPDLGPKMYIAYGSAGYANKASTNLHLDISDAVNVMCHVGIPQDLPQEEHVRDTLKAIDDASCDILTRQRVRDKGVLPGALWHIYHARDADKIRDLLNKVAIEKGKKLEPHHDPIHDQSWYLDGYLRERLYKEYGVEGYAIVQCMGDAVFIPAGAPHQVRNLHNCIKVAEDFVSPENIAHCFHLTQEFRHLSDTHTNHEDKLQIKNIIYHAMKDAVAILMSNPKSNQQV